MATDHWAPPAPSRPGSRRAASSRQGGARIQHAKWEGSDMDTWVREMNGIKVVRRAGEQRGAGGTDTHVLHDRTVS